MQVASESGCITGEASRSEVIILKEKTQGNVAATYNLGESDAVASYHFLNIWQLKHAFCSPLPRPSQGSGRIMREKQFKSLTALAP